ncbi:MAG: hypothetical protein COA82_03835 [Alkaliphilus sp.]|nr:MAG: hypothetical protein COA82_03835 [Alkaliphilus sp.]
MLGTIVNAIAIIIGGSLGVLLKKGIPQNYKNTIMQGIALSVFVIGMSGALKSNNILLVIFSIAIGSIIGEKLGIENKLDQVGNWLESKLSSKYGNVAKGFVTASLVYCVGAMAIVGSLESGMTGDHSTLFAKSLLDGISSILFASTLGIGVVFSSIAVFIYQGTITLFASLIGGLLTEAVILEMSAIGGILIMGISINILEIKKISVGNMLPAMFIPILYQIIEPFFAVIINIF